MNLTCHDQQCTGRPLNSPAQMCLNPDKQNRLYSTDSQVFEKSRSSEAGFLYRSFVSPADPEPGSPCRGGPDFEPGTDQIGALVNSQQAKMPVRREFRG